jgi:hypothetical protein
MCEDVKRTGVGRGARVVLLGLCVFAFLLAGCVVGEPAEPTTELAPSTLAEAFPAADIVPGWTRGDEVETFDSETIFSLVDGQADFFFVYGFEQVAVQRYTNSDGIVLDIQIWQLARPEDAYGLFTAGTAGEPADIGNEGDVDPGRRLAFWQDRYVTQMYARSAIADADLRGFADAISAALPSGGERPALMDRLPPDGLIARSAVFFHEELSIQSEIWLGGENMLGLSPDTDGVLARYELGGAAGRLLLIAYPGAEAASAGLAALASGEIESLVDADVRQNLLGAVFGDVDGTAAGALLAEALGE